jgi:hypothetical protein
MKFLISKERVGRGDKKRDTWWWKVHETLG